MTTSADILHDIVDRAGAGYEVIYADPPWRFSSNSELKPGRNAGRHYPTMRLYEVCHLPVRRIVACDAVLFLWITGPLMVTGAHVRVFEAWGFGPSSVGFVWIKGKRGFSGGAMSERDLHFGQGMTTRHNAEYCLMGRRGRSLKVSSSIREVIFAPVMEHSRKPTEAAERIRQYVGPGRRMVEMFSRETSPGFEALGNQLGRFDEAAE